MNNYKDKFNFENAKNYILNDEKCISEIQKLKIKANDVNTYFSYILYQNTDAINFNIEDTIKSDSKKDILNLAKKNLSIIGNDIYSRSHYLEIFVEQNNDKYKTYKFEDLNYANPWEINIEQIKEEFNELDKNDEIEIYAKNTIWSNRLTKTIGDLQKSLLDDVLKNNILMHPGILKKNLSNVINTIMRNTKNFDGQSLILDFLENYSQYLHGDLNSKKIYRKNSTKELKAIIRKSNINLSINDIFNQLACEVSKGRLYSTKILYQEKMVEEYARLEKESRLDGKFLAIVDVKNDHNSNNIFNQVLKLKIPGYNNLFSVHSSERYNNQLQDMYNIKIPVIENFGGYDYIQYKYSERQKSIFKIINKKDIYLKERVGENIRNVNYMLDKNENIQNVNESRLEQDAR